MTTKPTPTRKPTGRKAERPRRRWRALKVGDVRPRGYQFRNDYFKKWVEGDPASWGRIIDDTDTDRNDYRAPVTGKARSSAAARSTATAKGRRK